jgi:hypothetical protein
MGVHLPMQNVARCYTYTSNDEDTEQRVPAAEDPAAGKRLVATEASWKRGGSLDQAITKMSSGLRVVDDDEEDEDSGIPNLGHQSQKHPVDAVSSDLPPSMPPPTTTTATMGDQATPE